MEGSLNRSFSDSDITTKTMCITSPNFANTNKRRRYDEEDVHLCSFKEEIKEMITVLFTRQEQELKKILSTQCDIKQTNVNIEKSITFLTTQNEEFQQKIDKLEGQIREDRKYITILEDKLEEIQKDRRKFNFEITNVPRKQTEKKEDLIDIVMHLSKNVGCNLDKKDIKDIYRIRAKKDGSLNTKIIVETSSTMQKAELLKMCKLFNIKHKTKLRAKHLGFHTLEETPIFVSEHLTPKGSRLYFLARDLSKSKKYTFCWTSYGKVYIRKDENSPILTIRNEAQIQNLLQEN